MHQHLALYLALTLNARRKKRGLRCHYTMWIGAFTLLYFVLNAPRARTGRHWKHTWFVFRQTWALCWGSQLFWYLDDYRLMRQIGGRWTKSRALMHLGDHLLHTGPLLLVLAHVAQNRERLRLRGPPGAGLLLFGLHLAYPLLVQGHADPSTLYRVQTTPSTVINGWIIFFLAYLSSDVAARVLETALGVKS